MNANNKSQLTWCKFKRFLHIVYSDQFIPKNNTIAVRPVKYSSNLTTRPWYPITSRDILTRQEVVEQMANTNDNIPLKMLYKLNPWESTRVPGMIRIYDISEIDNSMDTFSPFPSVLRRGCNVTMPRFNELRISNSLWQKTDSASGHSIYLFSAYIDNRPMKWDFNHGRN